MWCERSVSNSVGKIARNMCIIIIIKKEKKLLLKFFLQKKRTTHLAGLEPATFRLTAERANRLRHKCLLPEAWLFPIYIILLQVMATLSIYTCTTRMQASGERRRVLHRRPQICMPNH